MKTAQGPRCSQRRFGQTLVRLCSCYFHQARQLYRQTAVAVDDVHDGLCPGRPAWQCACMVACGVATLSDRVQ